MTSPVDPAGLWLKAKAHLNRSFGSVDAGDFEQAALWAASALELLGKAALSKVNPLLVADPQDDGRSMLVAAGLSADESRFKSVPAKAVFSRCARAFPPFSDNEASRIAVQRNEELHSAATPFSGVDEDAWWQRYWAQAVLLIHAQDRTVAELVGDSREAVVEEFLARNTENIARRVRTMLERAAHRWELAKTSQDVQREIALLAARQSEHFELHAPIECPVCHQSAILLSDYVEDSDVIYDYEEGTATEAIVAASEAFECDSCGLRLTGAEYLDAAALPASFHTERDYEPPWDDYGND